jgi:hypothetical protein
MVTAVMRRGGERVTMVIEFIQLPKALSLRNAKATNKKRAN